MIKVKLFVTAFFLCHTIYGCTLSNHEIKPSLISKQRKIEKIAGSELKGETITNTNNSLSCTLKKWNLVRILDNKKIISTGEFVFEIVNHDSKSHKFVLAELLVLDKKGNVIKFSNPYQSLQGQLLDFSPPIKSTQTRVAKREWKFVKNWHKATLKRCQWLESESQYFEIYPELENYPIP